MSYSTVSSTENGYQPAIIESKWQQIWSQMQLFKAANPGEDNATKPPYYVLDMFPYPSGAGLHVGHPLGYIASDIYARYKRYKGFNVLHPMGYDSFGLPAEQYAIQTGQHPAKTTEENIVRYRQQLDSLGFSFDWSREVRTSDPSYYRWTQWIFVQLFNAWFNPKTQKAAPISTLIDFFEKNGSMDTDVLLHNPFTANEWSTFDDSQKEAILMHYRLAYLSEAFVNWCPAMGTVLANDEVKDGLSERGGYPVERKKMKQWSMRITAYADRLLNGLSDLDWSENVKEIQRNWIGKSEGCAVGFEVAPDSISPDFASDLKNEKPVIEVFTTRPDTLFGVSYLTLAPEHDWVFKLTTPSQKKEVDDYVLYAKNRSERDRQTEVKNISGVFTGAYALHPITQIKIPIWIGDYVLAGYGTGAVMAVPAHDERDFAFAKFFDLPIPQVVQTPNGFDLNAQAWSEKHGALINSDFLNGLDVKQAIVAMIDYLESNNLGKGRVNYRLRDAVFGRQRYWGEPIPMYYKKGVPYPVLDSHLPLKLPEIDKFLPTETGEPPLARAAKWDYDPAIGVVEKGKGFPLEATTMPGWAGSSWYFFRYLDPANTATFASSESLSYWKQVDFYVGGAEHATGHLLYARFWTHVLNDLGHVPFAEPFKKLLNQGMIQGESAVIYRDKITQTFVSADAVLNREVQGVLIDVALVDNRSVDMEKLKNWRPEFNQVEFEYGDKGFLCDRLVEKMSKSKWNVVNPDDICAHYGADTLRMYEMFLGPIEDAKPWSTKGIEGVFKFLKKTWRLFHNQEGVFEISNVKPTNSELKILHKTIKKITWDIENLSFNTSVSAFMICVNELQEIKCNKREILENLLILLSPFAPHIAAELWEKLGNNQAIEKQQWPTFIESYLVESSFLYPVSINGKLRTQIELALDLSKDHVEAVVIQNDVVLKWVDGNMIKKFIFVPGKIINIVV
jgi:leucyl-tRNA synthetase